MGGWLIGCSMACWWGGIEAMDNKALKLSQAN
jgi:hypothetical protein